MAVFTPVCVGEVRAFLKGYDVGDLVSLEGVVEGVENTNYRLQSEAGVFALTLFEKRTPPESLPYCLGLTEHVAGRGTPSPLPQRNRRGELLSRLADRPAALVRWLPGRWTAHPPAGQAEKAGRALAELHLAAADFPLHRSNALGPDAWAALVERCAPVAGAADAAMIDELEAEVDRLAACWPSGLPRGPIHADFFPDNVLFDRGRVSGVIDFYFACNDALAYDLAIGLNAWGFSAHGTHDPRRHAAFRRGYESVRPLSAAEAQALPVLCRGAAVRFTATRLHDQLFHDTAWRVTPKDPAPFFKRLSYYQRAGGDPVTLASLAAQPSLRRRPGRSSRPARAARATG